jgi:hypothetical protein
VSEEIVRLHQPAAEISAEAMKRAEEMIEREEGVQNRHRGWLAGFIVAVTVVMSLFHLYTAYAIVRPEHLRAIHLAFVLFLVFLIFPVAKRFRHRVMWWDWLLAAAGVATTVYLIAGGDEFFDRSIVPERLGHRLRRGAHPACILEAMRRTTGWILPFITGCFLAYAFFGAYLPRRGRTRATRSRASSGHMYMTLEGIWGPADRRLLLAHHSLHHLRSVPAVLGAGKFYYRLLVRGRWAASPRAPGRTVTLASFLLGGPSGSGVATTVTLGCGGGTDARQGRLQQDEAGGLLAAGGLGAIISPPVLGAAAFLIAEFLKISYLDVVLMAAIPTCLYYLALFIMVEIDVRKFGMKDVLFDQVESAWSLTKKYWFHFLSLFSIVVFMLFGFSPELSVFWATVVAFARASCTATRRSSPTTCCAAATPFWRGFFGSGLIKALDGGSRAVLNVAATCAGAGSSWAWSRLPASGSSSARSCSRTPATRCCSPRSTPRSSSGSSGPRRAGHRELHHLRGDSCTGFDRAQGARIRRRICSSSITPCSRRCRRPRRCRPSPPRRSPAATPTRRRCNAGSTPRPPSWCPFMFVLDPSGTGLAADGLDQDAGRRRLGLDRAGDGHRRGRHRRARRRPAGVALQAHQPRGAPMLVVAGFMLVYPTALFDADRLRAGGAGGADAAAAARCRPPATDVESA